MPVKTGNGAERTVTLAIPVALDRALELVGAKRDWTKKRVIAWALTGRGEVRKEMRSVIAQDAGIKGYKPW
jgi:hypothetical protein